jgi:hypothetical protein
VKGSGEEDDEEGVADGEGVFGGEDVGASMK